MSYIGFSSAVRRLLPPFLANKWRTEWRAQIIFMSITIAKKKSRNGQKTWYYFEWGKGADQRRAAKVFTYNRPKNVVEKQHNVEAINLLDTKKSQLILDTQATGTGYIPIHKFKKNFLDYYSEYVQNNRRRAKRHLENSYSHFIKFLKKEFLAVGDVTENLCHRFRQYLLDNFNGDTPANYFTPFKKMLRAATKEGYFRHNPAEDLKAKTNKNKLLKDHLEAEEYIKLLNTPCLHREVREAFIFCCYVGLRMCDVKCLSWSDIKGDQLQTRIIQAKTNEPLHISLHPIAKAILLKRKKRAEKDAQVGRVFRLPTHDGCNRIIKLWCKDAGIDKNITWHCARLSFSILLQDANVDNATVALLLGHTTTKHVQETYKRHRPKDQSAAIRKLPNFNPTVSGFNANFDGINWS